MDKNTTDTAPTWYTAEELAERYGVTTATIRRWVREGTIPTRPLPQRGRRYGLPQADQAA